jgi:hypothetical protein
MKGTDVSRLCDEGVETNGMSSSAIWPAPTWRGGQNPDDDVAAFAQGTRHLSLQYLVPYRGYLPSYGGSNQSRIAYLHKYRVAGTTTHLSSLVSIYAETSLQHIRQFSIINNIDRNQQQH